MMFCTLQALERELAPVEERLSKLSEMARRVVASNPNEARQVQTQQAEINELWEKLKVMIDYGQIVDDTTHYTICSVV